MRPVVFAAFFATAFLAQANGCSQIQSKYHGGDQHCMCPEGTRCSGSECSVGHGINDAQYSSKVFGYRAECADCSCEAYLPAVDIAEIRQRQELWIFGTHHKTGSFLNSRIWDHLRQAVTPHLNIKKNEFKPMDVGRWGRLAPTTDVVVTYHAQGISKDFASVVKRPYKFVHVVRDPVKQIVSALLYEIQRLGGPDHDKYHKTVRSAVCEGIENCSSTNHKEGDISEALFAIAEFMVNDVEVMETQFKQASQDPNAMNVMLEDFATTFDDTIERVFRFIGVPEALLPKFMKLARLEDLHRQTPAKIEASVHVTAGKYDKRPLEEALLASPKYSAMLARVRATMGYG